MQLLHMTHRVASGNHCCVVRNVIFGTRLCKVDHQASSVAVLLSQLLFDACVAHFFAILLLVAAVAVLKIVI